MHASCLSWLISTGSLAVRLHCKFDASRCKLTDGRGADSPRNTTQMHRRHGSVNSGLLFKVLSKETLVHKTFWQRNDEYIDCKDNGQLDPSFLAFPNRKQWWGILLHFERSEAKVFIFMGDITVRSLFLQSMDEFWPYSYREENKNAFKGNLKIEQN